MLRTDWVDSVGQKVNAAFLNQLGEEHNDMLDQIAALLEALDGLSLRVLTQAAFDALTTKDPDTVYLVKP
ncbi:hypothetical protein SEA_WILKINS_34 [Mycobacterium phage Wilkins]|uniref:Minor tail protein n=1 Tax=Mycobacterium phage LilBib TaxID=3136622 RepID=A0AAU8GKY5_9VIRU|nr:hypothetical protein PBI_HANSHOTFIRST_34 [Mycobacterium phage HanShotFirst]AOZ64074.1 hypothetical protein SEA_CACTUSROSE_33 [Mycobacterium phage CactusRose]ASZ74009.1 hypothetical protein SEA_SMAIRT_35 [Mycobacterium phage Smairt]ATW59819.1 hypothetical protein SEA_WILKINS_34 [Mycobacterium phage Wilkins]QNJ59678.1 hypothetical protein SEA_HARRYOW_35 [Mycobacterium phage HarryOW]QOI67085.1 hypothetical protein SEA_TOPGUN_34 [Mycobacterium phage Topgun]USH44397.1 hypothetical protein IGNAT